MANAAKKQEPGEYEASLVSNVVSTDPARPHLCTPFGVELNGRGYVAATDGHRLHATACDAWGRYARGDAPPAQYVIPWDSVPIGEFAPAALDDARALCVSVKWNAILELGMPEHKQRVFVSQKRPGKKAGTLHPFGRDGVAVDWFKLDGLRYALGVNLFYLLDAADFFWPAGNLFVWAAPYTKKHADESPIILTNSSKPLTEQDRIAVVMPTRL
jgi:hypothetical protein